MENMLNEGNLVSGNDGIKTSIDFRTNEESVLDFTMSTRLG